MKYGANLLTVALGIAVVSMSTIVLFNMIDDVIKPNGNSIKPLELQITNTNTNTKGIYLKYKNLLASSNLNCKDGQTSYCLFRCRILDKYSYTCSIENRSESYKKFPPFRLKIFNKNNNKKFAYTIQHSGWKIAPGQYSFSRVFKPELIDILKDICPKKNYGAGADGVDINKCDFELHKN